MIKLQCRKCGTLVSSIDGAFSRSGKRFSCSKCVDKLNRSHVLAGRASMIWLTVIVFCYLVLSLVRETVNKLLGG